MEIHCSEAQGVRPQASRPETVRYCFAALSAALTRAGVIGASWRRIPVASKNALATAAGAAAVGGSLEPVGVRLAAWTITGVTLGASLQRRIGYVTQSRPVTRLVLNGTPS